MLWTLWKKSSCKFFKVIFLIAMEFKRRTYWGDTGWCSDELCWSRTWSVASSGISVDSSVYTVDSQLFELKKSTCANLGNIFSNARSVFLSCLVVSNILVKSNFDFSMESTESWCCRSKVQMFIYDHTGEMFFGRRKLQRLPTWILRRQRRKKRSPTKMTLSELQKTQNLVETHKVTSRKKTTKYQKNTFYTLCIFMYRWRNLTWEENTFHSWKPHIFAGSDLKRESSGERWIGESGGAQHFCVTWWYQ